MIYELLRPVFAKRIRMVKEVLSLNLSSRMVSNDGSSPKRGYEETVKALNSLQTNAALIESYRKQGRRSSTVQKSKLNDTIVYLLRSGVTLEQLDSLSVIHVAGTKGKGSTCAICESILRQHGLKTGFYSSPHLVAVKERIRINGKPLNEKEFSKYFWQVFNALNKAKDNEHDLPPYFKFLTVMAFNAFLIEKVDVAIIEAGIGGEYDCTNILRKVPVIGITSLGLDHTYILGHTIEEIAWQKAGILKPGASAFTVQQPQGAWEVLQSRATERNCSLKVVPPIQAYDWGGAKVTSKAKVQNINASLALQLANAWLSREKKPKNGYKISMDFQRDSEEALAFKVTPRMLNGLDNCSWPGRMQTIHRGQVSFYLDGAHTSESIQICSEWFLSQIENSRNCVRVLVFNAIGGRDINNLLSLLLKCRFDVAIFCPNTVQQEVSATSDQANFMVTSTQQYESSKNILNIWNKLVEECQKQNDSKRESYPFNGISKRTKSLFLPCLADSVSYIEKEVMVSCSKTQVLVTGSLHLVGCMLHILDPELSNTSHQFFVEQKLRTSLSH